MTTAGHREYTLTTEGRRKFKRAEVRWVAEQMGWNPSSPFWRKHALVCMDYLYRQKGDGAERLTWCVTLLEGSPKKTLGLRVLDEAPPYPVSNYTREFYRRAV